MFLRLCMFLSLVVAVVFAAKAPLLHTDGKEIVKDEYLVIYRRNVTDYEVTKHESSLNRFGSQHKKGNSFQLNTFRGYSIKCNKDIIDKIRDEPIVRYVEQNQIYRANQAACKEQREATWGIVRTNERQLNLDGLYDYRTNAGEGVDAYVIDTGVYMEHVEFGNRASWGMDSVDTPSPETDLNGHGTHVAGTIAGTNYGLAKFANIIAVRVLDAGGSGYTTGVVEGMVWTGNAHAKKKNARSVANMSLGGGQSQAMNDAIKEAVGMGVVFVVASGNSAFDACQFSPASAPEAITVSCSDNKDAFCTFSNYGKCVDINAPGKDIESAWIGGKYANNIISGTSMSSPHVAGIAAKFMSESTSNMTPQEVASLLVKESTRNALKQVPDTETPNKLVYKGCGPA